MLTLSFHQPALGNTFRVPLRLSSRVTQHGANQEGDKQGDGCNQVGQGFLPHTSTVPHNRRRGELNDG